ncbi:MAG: Alcohol dehydrogenase GroES protein [Leptospirillum sp. Group IV 'UBA BS']|nr:MAG: Alcohol dehydrogenase GroES protein [Leptospirillum sp. Group IV 'UBA BS']
MRSVLLSNGKNIESLILDERPVPLPSEGEIRVRMRAHTLNHIDLWVLSGSPAYSVSLPHVMGSEGVGVVDALGENISPEFSMKVGDAVALSPGQGCLMCELCRSGSESLCPSYRVLGGHLPGVFSEYVCLPATRLLPVPPSLSPLSASAVTLAGATAHQGLVVRGGARAGERWLVVGASGGVGHLACLLAMLLKLDVFGTYGPEKKREILSRFMDIPLVSHEAPDWPEKILKLSGRPFDGVLDTVGGATIPRILPLLRKGGRAVVVGETTGSPTQFPTRELFGRQLSLHGVYLAHRSDILAMLDWVAKGDLSPIVSDVGPLASISPLQKAYRRMSERDFVGKLGFGWQ